MGRSPGRRGLREGSCAARPGVLGGEGSGRRFDGGVRRHCEELRELAHRRESTWKIRSRGSCRRCGAGAGGRGLLVLVRAGWSNSRRAVLRWRARTKCRCRMSPRIPRRSSRPCSTDSARMPARRWAQPGSCSGAGLRCSGRSATARRRLARPYGRLSISCPWRVRAGWVLGRRISCET